jgi:hypothetical protein
MSFEREKRVAMRTRRMSAGLALVVCLWASCMMAGCKSANEVQPDRFRTLSYGLERQQTLQQLDVEPQPLVSYFGGPAGGGTWRAFGCRAAGTDRSYVLLFTEDRLSAVTRMGSARALWTERFGPASAPALPDAAGLAALGRELLDGRLDLATWDFSTTTPSESREPGVMEDVEGLLEFSALAPVVAAGAVIIVPFLPFALYSSHLQSEEQQDLLARAEAFRGGESVDDAIAALGEPRFRRAVGSEEVLVFQTQMTPVESTSLGFSGGRLAWVAHSFDPRTTWEKQASTASPTEDADKAAPTPWIANDCMDRSPRTAFVP